MGGMDFDMISIPPEMSVTEYVFRRMDKAQQQSILLEKARDEAEDRAFKARNDAEKRNKGIYSLVFGKTNPEEKYVSKFTDALIKNMGMIGLKPSTDVEMLPEGYLDPEISTNNLYSRDPSNPSIVPGEWDFNTLYRNSRVINDQEVVQCLR